MGNSGMSGDGLRWDLSDLYAGLDDPRIDQDLSEALERAKAFEARWRGKINVAEGVAAAELATAVGELEGLIEPVGKASSYAQLLHAADTSEARHGALLQSVQQRATEIQQRVLFFDLEWMDVPDEVAERVLADPAIERYRHYLEQQRRYRPHRLSEPEEKIVNELANTGSRAWVRLFDEVIADIEFRVRVAGRLKRLNESQVLAMLYALRRQYRRAAAQSLTEGLKQNKRVLSYIVGTMAWDHQIDDRLRSFPDPMASRNLENEIDGETVAALLSACERAYPVVQRYYRLKGRLLGIDDLKDYDRYAPVARRMPARSFGQCRRMVVGAFEQFSPQAGQVVGQFFEKRWIDAEVRPGKVGGAFCAMTVPSVHPYVLCNYTKKPRDVMTVAHELGHGLHQYLARDVGYLQAHSPLTLAETASVFGEMLVFERLMDELGDSPAGLALLCSKIEDTFATVFRQVVMTRFEQLLHGKRRQEGELSCEQVGQLWMEANRPMHGEVVELTEDYSWWWMYIPHFVHSPFYCYAYAFGELLVLALYQMYRQQGADFVPSYLELLSAGGSDSPDRLLARMGVDVRDEGFWARGLSLIEQMVGRAEGLAAAVAS